MIAIILNSGMGTRMGELTQNRQKCMVTLKNGETIFQRQLRILYQTGIRDFLITTGPYEDVLRECALTALPDDCRITFVHNEVYSSTNYIYSLYLARENMNDDALLLHGDLVFDKELPGKMIRDPRNRLVTVNYARAIPEKDFKARVIDGKVTEIGVDIFGDDCHAMQPFYKMDRAMVETWKDEIINFIESDQNKCYAENALNVHLPALDLLPYDCSSDYIEEIDTPEDYQIVCDQIRRFDFVNQRIEYSISQIPELLSNVRKTLLVCDKAYDFLPVKDILSNAGIDVIRFSEFKPNPKYEEAQDGVELFIREKCDSILSVGGGSAIDVAKCIKLFAALKGRDIDGANDNVFSPILHIAVPSTAGTGSECTRYAVVYRNGEKQSVTSDTIFPDVAVLDSCLLETLPEYQKKCGYLDALCHGIESAWSKNADVQSSEYSYKAINTLVENFDSYFNHNSNAAEIMYGAYVAGQAINITQTTAGHAMCYKLTSMYQIAHGHAAALCVRAIWKLLLHEYERGSLTAEVEKALQNITAAFCVDYPIDAWNKFCGIVDQLNIASPVSEFTPEDLAELVSSVNTTRLVNFPIKLTTEQITEAYLSIV